MRSLSTLFQTELKLFTREFFSFFFTLVFPLLMLLLFGGIYGNTPVYEGASVKMMDVSVPAYCVMVMGVTGLMSLPLTLANCKEKKIYKRFDATPAGKSKIMFAQITVNILMTLIGIAILIIAGILIYDIKIKGTFISILTGLLLSIAAMFSLGFLLTAIGNDVKTTSLLCYLFYFIMLFLSGATMPDMLFPDTIRNISNLLPMTYAVDLMQGVFAGKSLNLLGKELLILGAVTISCMGVGIVLYRKRDWA